VFLVRNLDYGFLVFQFSRNKACLREERGQFHYLFNMRTVVQYVGLLYAEL